VCSVRQELNSCVIFILRQKYCSGIDCGRLVKLPKSSSVMTGSKLTSIRGVYSVNLVC
jgi:hypothetical protein